MVNLISPVVWALILLSSMAFIAIGYRTYRVEHFPGARSFAGYSVLLGLFLVLFTAVYSFGAVIRRTGGEGAPRWVVAFGLTLVFLLLILAVLSPVSWIRFVLIYTGQRIPTTRRTFLLIGIPVLAGVAGFFVLFIIAVSGIVVGFERIGDLPLSAVLDYILAFVVFYVAALLVAGAMLVGWTNYTYRHLPTRGGALLGIGAILPWAVVAIPMVGNFFEGQPLIFAAHTAVGSVVGALAVGGAITRYGVFDNIPTAGTVGRDVTVDEMKDPVVVVDNNQLIIDLNPAADDLLETTPEAIGEPLSNYIGSDESAGSLLDKTSTTNELEIGNRIMEATPSELLDDQGRTIGHSIVFHDVTALRQQEQRIQVLNRVLRHNLRNDLNAVNGYAELLEDQTSDPGDYLIQIQELATELISIGEKAREIEEVVATKRAARTGSLADVIDQAVEEVRSEYESCGITAVLPAKNPDVNSLVLSSVLRELLENSCRHNDAEEPTVEVVAQVDSTTEYPIHIRVSDNGPGIPAHELTPLREGAESALEHGSGLGLWLVQWGVAKLNGQIEFGQNEPRGTIANLRLPPTN